jgi:hypothetical protein
MQLNTPGKLPGWLESIGINIGEYDKNLYEWRRGILKKYDRLFIKLLETQDPASIYKGMRRFAGAMAKFDEAVAIQCDGALDEIAANQTLIKDTLESLPLSGEVLDVIAVTGYIGDKMGMTKSSNWTLNGDEVTALDAVMRFAGVAGPKALEKAMERSATLRAFVHKIGNLTAKIGHSAKEALNKALGRMPESVQRGWKAIVHVMTKEYEVFSKETQHKIKSLYKSFNLTKEGKEALERKIVDEKRAMELIEKLKKQTPGTPEFKKMVAELQSNKTAQRLINEEKIAGNNLRKKVNEELRNVYKATDHHSAKDLKRLLTVDEKDLEKVAKELHIDPKEARRFREKTKEFCKKNGIEVNDVQIEPLTVTNKRPGAKKNISVGRDRDVTYQIKKIDSNGKVVAAMDVDHTVSRSVYEQNFYKEFHGGKLPDNPEDVSRWVHEHMDQTVTSKLHSEAYNTGEVALDDFLDKGITPTLTRPEDVADTVAYKSQVWFDRAAKSKDPILRARNIQEGMRQAKKQWKDLILSRGRQYGLKPYNYPKDLVGAMQVFSAVADGEITVEAGEHILKKLYNLTPEDVTRRMSGFLLGMEKTVGNTYRKTMEKKVVHTIGQIYHTGNVKSAEKALEELNNALRQGKISGTKFLDLRHQIIQGTIKQTKDPAILKRWLEQRLISKSEAVIEGEK